MLRLGWEWAQKMIFSEPNLPKMACCIVEACNMMHVLEAYNMMQVLQ
jgi:hypothetical protein